MTRSIRALLFLPALALTGCLEYAEELALRPDGSARLGFDLSIHGDLVDEDELPAMRAKIREALEELRERPEIIDADFEDFRSDAMHHFVFSVHAKDARWFGELHRDNAVLALRADLGGGLYRFEELDGGRLRVTRNLGLDRARRRARRGLLALGARLTGPLGDGFNPDDPFEDKFFRFTIKAPRILGASDGAERGRSEARWRYELNDEEMELPTTLSVVYKLQSLDWLLWAGAAAFLAGLLLWFRGFWSRGGLRKSFIKAGLLD